MLSTIDLHIEPAMQEGATHERTMTERSGGEVLSELVELASLMPASWNRIDEWLRRLDALRKAA